MNWHNLKKYLSLKYSVSILFFTLSIYLVNRSFWAILPGGRLRMPGYFGLNLLDIAIYVALFLLVLCLVSYCKTNKLIVNLLVSFTLLTIFLVNFYNIYSPILVFDSVKRGSNSFTEIAQNLNAAGVSNKQFLHSFENDILQNRVFKTDKIEITVKAQSSSSHPPAPILLNRYFLQHPWNLNQNILKMDAAANGYYSLAIVILALAALTPVFVYLFVSLLSDSKIGALAAFSSLGLVQLYAYPSFFDVANASLIMLTLLLLLTAKNRLWLVLLAGIPAAINLAFSFGALVPNAFIFLGIAIYYYRTLKDILTKAVVFIIPSLILFTVYAVNGFNYINGFLLSSRNLDIDYNYLYEYRHSLKLNTTELIANFNYLNLIILLIAMVFSVHELVRKKKKGVFVVSFSLLIVLLVISGKTRYEMARTAMYIYPLLVASSFIFWQKMQKFYIYPIVLFSVYASSIWLLYVLFKECVFYIFLTY